LPFLAFCFFLSDALRPDFDDMHTTHSAYDVMAIRLISRCVSSHVWVVGLPLRFAKRGTDCPFWLSVFSSEHCALISTTYNTHASELLAPRLMSRCVSSHVWVVGLPLRFLRRNEKHGLGLLSFSEQGAQTYNPATSCFTKLSQE
jgi:hypothetical protein